MEEGRSKRVSPGKTYLGKMPSPGKMLRYIHRAEPYLTSLFFLDPKGRFYRPRTYGESNKAISAMQIHTAASWSPREGITT
jgi:hypothetical protein